MAQTTSVYSMTDGVIEFSTNGSSWTDISGSMNGVEAPEQTRMSGEDYTVSGDKAIVTSGKLEPAEVAAKIVYSETAGEAFEVIRAAWETPGQKVYLRWGRGGSGSYRYTTDAGVLTSFTYPPLSAPDAKPKVLGIKVKTPGITKSVVS